jgi:hypothetical protein
LPQTILRDICKFVNNTIYAIVPFSRPDMLENVKNNFTRQAFCDKKLVLVENGPGIGTCKKYNFTPDILLTSDAHQSHAKNTAINELNKRGGGFWTTFDDDDWYGKKYISELHENRNKAAIIGKYEIFVQMSDGELNLFLGAFENAFTEYVHGPTISAMAENSIEFSSANEWGEDGQWVYDMRQLGAHLYSTSRWNFVVQRTPHPHTWEATDDQIRQIYFRREPLVGKNYGKVSSYEFVERTIPEPEFDFITPIPFDMFRDNPAHNALKKKITTRTDEQAQELAGKILNGTLKSNQGG